MKVGEHDYTLNRLYSKAQEAHLVVLLIFKTHLLIPTSQISTPSYLNQSL
jgi:hypothetical protein